MLADVGLDGELRWVETRTGYYGTDGDAALGVEHASSSCGFPGLGLLDKVRLGGTIFYGSQDPRRAAHGAARPSTQWLRRWSGRSARSSASGCRCCGRSWATATGEASAAFIWATIQRLYAARRTGLKKEMFGYVPGGYARTSSASRDVLAAEGVKIETGASGAVDPPARRRPRRARRRRRRRPRSTRSS